MVSRTIDVRHGDCRDVIKSLPDESVDSCVTDPPYALTSIVKRFANSPRSEVTENRGNPYGRTGAGFMGQRWDTEEVVHDPAFWSEVFRVLKPGAHLAAFAGTRTYHRMVCAIEDAGFEIRDTVAWLYGTGFPKSHDLSKGIDKAAGAKRQSVGKSKAAITSGTGLHGGVERSYRYKAEFDLTEPASEDGLRWQGWGTALKPAFEPIVLARKSLSEGTVAGNVLRYGTGALNIDACRVGGEASPSIDRRRGSTRFLSTEPAKASKVDGRIRDRSSPEFYARERSGEQLGRWPANVAHDGSDEVLAAFPNSAGGHWSGETPSLSGKQRPVGLESWDNKSGSAARFFFSAKADVSDRLGSKHPTVKPLDLMRWLVMLVTPPGGTVLDPFAGTGSTGIAARSAGFDSILIERDEQYVADIRERVAFYGLSGKKTRAPESKTYDRLF